MRTLNISSFSLVIFSALCLPNFHTLNTGIPYILHIGLGAFFILMFWRERNINRIILILMTILLLMLIASSSLLRQLLLTGQAKSGDFGYFAKLIILLLGVIVGGMINVNTFIAKKTILAALLLIITFTLLQYFIPLLSFIYNNANLIEQGRFGSFGITHYEATSISILFCGFYLSLILRETKKLGNAEGFLILMGPMITSVLSMSKAALIICFVWFIVCLPFYKNKKTMILIIATCCGLVFLAFNNYIMVLYHGLSDLGKISSTQNLSIITRLEDFSNFNHLFNEHNLALIGIGPNRSSYFHYFEVGILSNLVNIGLIGTVLYYFCIFCLCMLMFPKNNRLISCVFFLVLFFADCLVNFNDGVKSLFFIGILSSVIVRNKQFVSMPSFLITSKNKNIKVYE